ncbi:hypothetical protein [Sphingomonas pokkalii]|uniref:Uncharacterized protein n=1 Tax=Sphingomonas pokkalii TaxID=2175090 RepID=A0A2U0SA79_9SPHN|nr:hypothetical protein [Sphingomonas pokkalii]PVX28185.1 hypothetical protein DD559_01535 [Sphingomonas pokkalii]
MQLEFWCAAGAAVLVAIASGLAEHRRRRRRDLERVGVMPWMAIQMAALFATLLLASLALHAG